MYAGYYNELRTHRSLTKDTPLHRIVERLGTVSSQQILGGPSPSNIAESNIRHTQATCAEFSRPMLALSCSRHSANDIPGPVFLTFKWLRLVFGLRCRRVRDHSARAPGSHSTDTDARLISSYGLGSSSCPGHHGEGRLAALGWTPIAPCPVQTGWRRDNSAPDPTRPGR